jgi:hypothetical protein
MARPFKQKLDGGPNGAVIVDNQNFCQSESFRYQSFGSIKSCETVTPDAQAFSLIDTFGAAEKKQRAGAWLFILSGRRPRGAATTRDS